MRSEVVQAFRPAFVAAVFVCILPTTLAAQRGGRGGGAEFAGPPQGPNAIPIVETIGCLADGPDNTWTLSSATEPAKSGPGFSKAEDAKAAEVRPLGTLQIRLIGLVEMHPEEHKGHKVLAKGLLVKDGAGQRLNITSLTTVSPTCAK
jgi:hypothetical protein